MASIITTVRKLVTVAPGVELFSERVSLTANTSPKETIIFVHGLGVDMNGLFPIFSSILISRPESVLLAYDWAGSGLSPFPANSRPNPTFNDFVTDLAKFVELEAPEGPLTFVSHSAGTLMVLRLLTSPSIGFAHASRVKAVVFISGPLGIEGIPAEAHAAQKHVAEVIQRDGVSAVVDGITGMMTGPTTLRERPLSVALMRSMLLNNSKEAYSASTRAMIAAKDDGPHQWDRLPSGIRALFVGGNEDKLVTPALLEGYTRVVAGSKVAIVNAGHSPTVEVPDECAKAIVEFLN